MSRIERRNANYQRMVYAPINGSSAIASSAYSSARNVEPMWVRQVSRKPPVARRSAYRMPLTGVLVLSMAVVLCIMGFAILMLMSQSAQNQRNIAALTRQIASTQETNAETKRHLTLAGDGESVRNYAVNKLGMVLPSGESIRRITLPEAVKPKASGAKEHGVPQVSLSFLGAMVSLLD